MNICISRFETFPHTPSPAGKFPGIRHFEFLLVEFLIPGSKSFELWTGLFLRHNATENGVDP